MKTIFPFLFLFLFLFQACDPDSKNRNGNHFETSEKEIHTLIDQWHRDAAGGDTAFFHKMTPTGIYIGTDKSELWEREDFRSWSKTYFDRGKAWDFTPISRNVYFSENGKTAWFDELLDTWMGVCRSSGVVIRTNEGWRIAHYHLSHTVPNDALQDVMEVIEEFEEGAQK